MKSAIKICIFIYRPSSVLCILQETKIKKVGDCPQDLKLKKLKTKQPTQPPRKNNMGCRNEKGSYADGGQQGVSN